MTRSCQEHQFTTHDGQSLFYRRWPATGPQRRGAVVMFHRGHEHGGRMEHLVDELGLSDFDFYAWDARGHGRSPGPRGYSPSFAHSVRDVQTFIHHLRDQWQVAEEDMAVLAQSVGAVLVSTWAHDYAPRVRCLVLASPAFKVKLYVPFARPGLALQQKLRGNFFVNSYVKAKYLTHDRQRQASYDSDPLISRPISVNILLALYEAAERVVADAQAITIPTQLLISGADWVVHHGPQHDFFARLGTPVKEKHVLPGFYHDTFGEKDRKIATDLAREFILRQFSQAWARPDLRQSHRQGPTFEESRQLSAPLPALSPKGLYWAGYRANMKLGGLLSKGVALGHRTGFDSGSTLDYVYRNTSEGVGPLGRAIDRQYLDAIGWKGIRQRKLHVEELLRTALARLQAEGQPLHVLDIAAGHGRYVLEALGQGPRPHSILLRDYSELNVQQGTALIADKGLADIARFVQGDAFDRASLAAVTPRPTVGIVSGLYELFPDNDAVATSLAGLADAIAPGGYLVYTGQPWHPQLELIARALTSHRGGQAWVMRRRTQAEMDQLVAEAGFEKIEQRIDQWGIFTVSLARRKAA
ncbi:MULTISPECIES: bifunctional alpha/beta hydrolase/class I SAM-dependent methyltransferase [Herbaspirillum]|uniref:Bifunctional alpha/beta hydrolase/class I SAM-dependent methyltransferase n=1 Tax=Herbaspirillum huttiense subsp. lycopersici TaxID=3074428 RepID=A0ABU2EUJ9_9BURK|nr:MULTISPECIES: bifunctional alpha/beta hydrolase/class I SAM-dependent methyltransferase [Herbaspirillum]MBP1318044.1 alpha-beta hydrolase superfamily lysophospholipase/SAM-dependent methyltransferase [Herbaspirillum sp. 1130]MDR6742932.1 alpha-beta hydrolase superfamily lysophospholipase/SAM-dependent methyltransferase [Herbaspirillum sp. 1173]MDR9851407.1 bifunctional alpha/beta hydrolase/class I SAM-dependent methyltransferase [Herbaspirillum huttiense SE1]